jgi:acetoacetyl-CoA synthetase
LNVAENILYSWTAGSKGEQSTELKRNSKVAFTAFREGGTERQDVTWKALRESVKWLAAAMKIAGVRKGDKIMVIASNSPDTLTVLLACTALGAVFSSTSTEMGVQVRFLSSIRVSCLCCANQ